MDAHASDPRTRVTPESFRVSERLLGWPLASPGRRLLAVLVDLVVVGILTLLGWRVLGVLAATLFVWFSVRGPAHGRRPTPGRRAMRWSGGCLGALIVFALVVTSGEVVQWGLSRLANDAPVQIDVRDDAPGIAETLGSLGNLAAFRTASTAEEAQDLAVALIGEGSARGLPESEIRALLLEVAPDDADWEADEVVERAFASVAPEGPPTDAPSDIPVPAALDEYRSTLEVPDSAVDAARRARLEAVILAAVGSDSLEALAGRAEALESDVERANERNAALQAELAEAREGGLFSWVLNTVDQLGLTFGWGALYFAFLLSWFDGLTPGKKLMGIRVKRLDGEPMTWFLAFERSGGYAAGFATGLLGFAQLLWDDNRQAIHDRIAGTVVVRDVQSVRPGPGVQAPRSGAGLARPGPPEGV